MESIKNRTTSEMWKHEKKVHFEETAAEPTQGEFFAHFEMHARQSSWLYLIFFLTCWVDFFLHMSGTKDDFITSKEVSCLGIDLLARNNWTYFQKRNISLRAMRYNCEHVGNLDKLLTYSFERALNELSSGTKPAYVTCSSKSSSSPHYNDTLEFSEACRNYHFRQRLKLMHITGEIIAPLPLGYVCDMYGRKFGIAICLALWTLHIFLTGLISNRFLSPMFGIIEGMFTIGMKVCCHILFLELCHKSERGLMCLYLDIFRMVGWIVGVHLKENYGHHKTHLTFLLACPIVMLYFYLWYVPESPRWCISYGKKKKAWGTLKKLGVNIDGVFFLPPVKFNKRKVFVDNAQYLTSYIKYKKALVLGSFLHSSSLAVYETEAKFTTELYLTVKSHVSVMFLCKLISHIYMGALFIILGRQLSIFVCVITSAVIITTSVFVNNEYDYYLNMLEVVCLYKLQRLVLLYISEIVPTSCRCSFIGLFLFISNLFYLFHFIYQGMILGSVIKSEDPVILGYQIFGMAMLFTLPYKGAEELPDYKIYRE